MHDRRRAHSDANDARGKTGASDAANEAAQELLSDAVLSVPSEIVLNYKALPQAREVELGVTLYAEYSWDTIGFIRVRAAGLRAIMRCAGG